jgi:hypothetical protein
VDADRYEVLIFSSANLFRALSNDWCTADEVALQERARYLLRYLDEINAKAIVVEEPYTDGDYLEDFASYYVRCYTAYNRQCKRLHFFSTDVGVDSIRSIVLNDATQEQLDELRRSYLGFVVARPLPNAIVGRTVLKTYDSDSQRRNYTVLKKYSANMFGVDLTVDSLAYQEQDSVLAACATVALWCAFQQTAALFGTAAPRPAVITRSANRFGHRGRPVPSRGLRVEQMCHAVSDVGLEPELVELEDSNVPLVSLVYAYLRMSLPVILIVRIDGDLHAITLTGYSLLSTRAHSLEIDEAGARLPMVGLRINELYGHDDQIGPFSRLTIADPSSDSDTLVFNSDWKTKSGETAALHPVAVLIPVYNKIRVTFRDVQKWVSRLHRVLRMLVPEPSTQMEWDVFITTSNNFKREIQKSSLPAATRADLLFAALPRFLWRALLRVEGSVVIEVLLDATDMARSLPVKKVLWHHPQFAEASSALLYAPRMQSALSETLTPRFLAIIKDSIGVPSSPEQLAG